MTYNEMLTATWEAAKAEEKTAELYECTAPQGVKYVHSVFRGNNNTTLMCNAYADGKVTEVAKFDSPWCEDVVIHMPIKLTLEEANDILAEAGYKADWSQVVLRNPLGPEHNNPEYIYSYESGANIAVDTFTKKVVPLT